MVAGQPCMRRAGRKERARRWVVVPAKETHPAKHAVFQ